MDECKPLDAGAAKQPAQVHVLVAGRGLHSLTSQLNLSAFCGTWGAFRGCVGGVEEVSGGIRGCLGCILCQTRLRLS